MTPYERSKVLETFLRLQREMRDDTKMNDQKDPRRIQQDLSMCLSVGTVKAGPNPHVRMAEKKFGFSQASNIKFDAETLRDPKRIVQKVVKMQTQATIEDAEELSSQKEDLYPQSFSPIDMKGMISKEMGNMTETQMLEELDFVRQQKEILIKEHPELLQMKEF